jgi:serine/threonine protein kinase
LPPELKQKACRVTDSPNTGILSAGEVLNNTYVISDLIASGGTGEVYRATNRVSGREIAIKILKREFAQNEQFTNLMKREASVLHEVIDPAVVRYYDLLESDMHGGFLFIVMEFIEGTSLAGEMKSKGPLDSDTLLKVAERVLLGLKAAHEKNAFHRDLSPDNILLRGGDPMQATIIDFGIAKDVNEGAKTVVGGGFAGKYQYASPEQMEGRSDARSDLYSLGMTIIGAYRGQAPNSGSSLMQIISAKAVKPDISDMSGALKELVSRLIEPNADERLQSAAAALAFLRGSGNTPGTASDEKTVMPARTLVPQATAKPAVNVAPPPIGRPAKSRSGLYAAVAVAILGLGGAGAWFGGLIGPSGPIADPTEVALVTPTQPTAGDNISEGTPTQPTTGSNISEGTPTTPADIIQPTTPESQPVVPQTSQPLPLADPFVLTIERTSRDDPLRLLGNLPSSGELPIVTTRLEENLNAFAVLSDVTVAQGEPFAGWHYMVVDVALLFEQFDSWTVTASGSDLILIAKAQNDLEKTALLSAVRAAIDADKLSIVDRITVETPALDLAQLRDELQSVASCGPLGLSGSAGDVVGATDTLTVSGQLAGATDVSKVQAFFGENAPGRTIQNDTTVINPGVCAILNILPAQNSADLSILYSYGTKSGAVDGDVFHMGENPVIDIQLPSKHKGFLSVIFVDLDNQVFHLLPHQARLENDLQKIGTVKSAKRTVRVAFPVADASIQQLGFQVVEPLGANIILAVVTDTPLFDETRARAESNAAFVEALNGQLAAIPEKGGLVTYRFLMTLQ